ncbi:MAG: prepilin-type N-terminal cleavage/methylation domain-containing protein [Campylobacterales bacterium]|nr:prepilin-type N-terminal cleavage/methylation domain-containing protein [Campylobacterales bacterium]
MKRAFTMIEMVFVIVVLGILAGIAIPKLTVTRDDAMIVKGKSQVAAIRSGIALQKSKRLLEGDVTALTLDSNTTTTAEGQELFKNVLDYPIISKNADGHWMKTNAGYSFKILGQSIPFTYNATTGFTCDTTNSSTGENCKSLTQ